MQTLSLHQFPCKAYQFLLLSGFLLLKWFIYFSDNGVTVAIKISVYTHWCMFKCVDCMCVIKTYTMDWAWTIEKLWLYIFAWNFIQILNNDWDLSVQWLITLMVLMQFSVKPAIFIIIDLSNYTKNIKNILNTWIATYW